MAEIKTDKIALGQPFHISLGHDWNLHINVDCKPTVYTLTHGKKTINFSSDVTTKLCSRQYGLRLVEGRRQMVIPPHILQSFVENALFLEWYDPCMTISANQNDASDHVTSPNPI